MKRKESCFIYIYLYIFIKKERKINCDFFATYKKRISGYCSRRKKNDILFINKQNKSECVSQELIIDLSAYP